MSQPRLTVEELGDLIRQACAAANKVSSVASSDPWWIVAAAWLLPRIEAKQ